MQDRRELGLGPARLLQAPEDPRGIDESAPHRVLSREDLPQGPAQQFILLLVFASVMLSVFFVFLMRWVTIPMAAPSPYAMGAMVPM